MINRFVRLYETLGTGAFSKVKRAMLSLEDDEGNPIEEEYAVKIYNKEVLRKKIFTVHDKEGLLKMKRQLDLVYKEIEMWERLEHKNVCMVF